MLGAAAIVRSRVGHYRSVRNMSVHRADVLPPCRCSASVRVRNRTICRVEHLGTWLDLVIVAGGLYITLLGLQALRTVRSRKYTAHKHWSLLHIAAGHGVNT